MNNITIYLNFNGNSEEAMTLYKHVLGGEFTSFNRFRDMPGGDKMAPDEQDQLMHVTLTTPGGLILMATDVLKSMEMKVEFGNNAYICVHTDSEKETDEIFNGLSDGAVIVMPVNQTFWGAYCGMLRDRFGVQWMISHTYPQK